MHHRTSELDRLQELLERRGIESRRETDPEGEEVLAYSAGGCEWVAKAEAAYGFERLNVTSARALSALDAIRVTDLPEAMPEKRPDVAGRWVYLSGPDEQKKSRDKARIKLMEMDARIVFDPRATYARTGWTGESRLLAGLHELTSATFASGFAKPVFGLMVLMDGWALDPACCMEVAVATACGIEMASISDVLGEGEA